MRTGLLGKVASGRMRCANVDDGDGDTESLCELDEKLATLRKDVGVPVTGLVCATSRRCAAADSVASAFRFGVPCATVGDTVATGRSDVPATT